MSGTASSSTAPSSSPTSSATLTTHSSAASSLAATSAFPTPSSSPASQTIVPTTTIVTPSSSPSATKSSSEHVNTGLIIGGVAIALLILVLIFVGTIWWLRRRWRLAQRNDARRAVYEATAQHDHDENEDIQFFDQGRARSASASASTTSQRPKNDRRMSSLGTSYTPGIALNEAYTMFGGGSTASFTRYRDDAGPETETEQRKTHARRVSDPLGGRASTEFHRDNRYPGMGHRTGSHSISFGVIDAFGDTSPHASPPPFHRAFTTGDPPRAATPATPPIQGRRISLTGGVGRVQRSPVTSPRSPTGPRAPTA